MLHFRDAAGAFDDGIVWFHHAFFRQIEFFLRQERSAMVREALLLTNLDVEVF